MSARGKLNQAYFNGALVLAGVAGLLAESWAVFTLTLCVLLAANLFRGEIRPGRPPRGRKT